MQPNRHATRLRRSLLVPGLVVSIIACSEPETPAPIATPVPASTTTPPENAMVSARALVERGNAAFREGRLFEPPGDSALDHYVEALAMEASDESARAALGDLFPLALARIETAIAAGDVSVATRLLGKLERAYAESPALKALQERLAAQQQQMPPSAISPVNQTSGTPASAPLAARTAPAEAATDVAAADVPGPPNAASVSAAASTEDAPSATVTSETGTPVVRALDPPVLDAESEATASAVSPPAAQESAVAAETPPRIVARVAPEYPTLARQRRIEGWVELEYVVGVDGRVRDVRVLDSYPNRVFDSAAERSLLRWQFVPGTRDGEPSETVGRTRLDFALDNGG